MTEKPESLLTPDDLAELLGVPRLFIIKQSHAGKIPAIKIGKTWRFREATPSLGILKCRTFSIFLSIHNWLY
jgi:excisionase family DNA binding protein